MTVKGSRETRLFRDASIARSVALILTMILVMIDLSTIMLANDHDLVSLLCMFTVKSIFTRFNGQSFGEETENLKKILEKRKVDEILNFLQQSPSSTQIYCFQVIFRSFL